MAHALDITGQRYGRLVAVCNTGRRQVRNFIWRFRCDCGSEIERASGEVRGGKTSSCGCLSKELAKARILNISGLGATATRTHGMTGTPSFTSWDSMKQRCLNSGHKSYSDYGGRGIKICDRWVDSFENFFADMGLRPVGKTLDRKDTNGNYEPENCQWSTAKAQSNNRRSSRLIAFGGLTRTLKQWADGAGISDKTLAYRLKNGWNMKDALMTKTNYGNGWKRGVKKL